MRRLKHQIGHGKVYYKFRYQGLGMVYYKFRYQGLVMVHYKFRYQALGMVRYTTSSEQRMNLLYGIISLDTRHIASLDKRDYRKGILL